MRILDMRAALGGVMAALRLSLYIFNCPLQKI